MYIIYIQTHKHLSFVSGESVTAANEAARFIVLVCDGSIEERSGKTKTTLRAGDILGMFHSCNYYYMYCYRFCSNCGLGLDIIFI